MIDKKSVVPRGMLEAAETAAMSLWPIKQGHSILPEILAACLSWLDEEIEKLELCSVDYKNIHRLLYFQNAYPRVHGSALMSNPTEDESGEGKK
jgi:hypothetical protein